MKKILGMALSLTLIFTLFTCNTYAANYDYGDYYKGHKIVKYNYSTYPVIRKGDTGEVVETLQNLINGWYIPSNTFLDVDGIFGPDTEDCVIEFQQTYHLGVDGIVGPETWAKLYS